MNPGNRVEIVDRDGWRKEFPLEKPLIYIGSDALNEIPLHASRGGGVAPRHLQLIAVPGDRPGYRAINLGDTDVVLGDEGDRSLQPRSAAEVTDGERFQVGEFTLLFHLGGVWAEGPPREGARPAVSPVAAPGVQAPAAPAGQRTSASIGVRLSLPRSKVDPNSPLEGIVAVRNLGNEPGAQFRLEVEGLEPDWYEIGSGPILFPNVEKGVRLRIRHPRGPGILAGRREISICCTAPEAYPGESVTVSHVLEILPFYHHELRLISTD
jgi:hypothetical protein